MGSFSITHWLIFLAVVAIVFGTSKLKNIGKDVGGAVKDFKDAVQDETSEQAEKTKKRILEHKDTETLEPTISKAKQDA